ncbi:MAG: hypothetical protein WBA57_21350 [Elainellaceae cyanobacterium]
MSNYMTRDHYYQILERIYYAYRSWNMHTSAKQIITVAIALRDETLQPDEWRSLHTMLNRDLNRNDPEASFWLDMLDEIDEFILSHPTQLTLF